METQLEALLRARQQYLWDRVVKEYGIDRSENEQVHKWIDEGVIATKSLRKQRVSTSQTTHTKQ